MPTNNGTLPTGREGRAPTLGLLVDRLQNEYAGAIVGGVTEAVRESGASLVCLVGGPLVAPDESNRERNTIYELGNAAELDGLIVLGGTLSNSRGMAGLAAFCERFGDRPIVSVAAELPGLTSILIDDEHALRDGVRHLVEAHSYRRIAYIGGPSSNLEAQIRLATYREVLAAYDLAPSEDLVTVGDFRYDSGVEAVRQLLDDRGQAFDAIVAANDQMALGAIDALRARGRWVPRDVAIIGFDDIREARHCVPPLTTVRQPLHAQGRLAVEELLRQLAGQPGPAVLTLPTELVVRRSCGCYADVRQANTTSNLPPPLARPGTRLSVADALAARRARILQALAEPLAGMLPGVAASWAEELLDALIAELDGQAEGTFADCVNSLLERSMIVGGTGNVWQPALSGLRRELMPCLVSDPFARSRAEDLVQEARVLVADAVEHLQAQRRLTVERRTRALAATAEAISATLDIESLRQVLAEWLPRLGVPAAYVVLHEPASTEADGPDRERRLVIAHDPARALPPIGAGLRFAGNRLAPEGALPDARHYAMVVEPLYFKDDALGYLICEFGPLDGLIYESLRASLSGVLKVALLLADLQRQATELGAAYQALQEHQQRLISSEKMASLGRITANIAHEMNTPLAAVRTALVEIEKRTTEYRASIGDDEVTAQDHAEIAAELRASVALARNAAERAAGFVRGIKTQTRDISIQERIRFDPAPVIEEALLLLSYDLRRSACQLEFRPPERAIEVFGSPGLLAQVVTNLVTNAVDAIPATGGSITLTLSETDRAVRLVVQDTGSGIPLDLRDVIFEPMFTTKAVGEGTGLGLAIVRDLVTGQFGGSVALDSEVGVGTTFTVELPLAKAS